MLKIRLFVQVKSVHFFSGISSRKASKSPGSTEESQLNAFPDRVLHFFDTFRGRQKVEKKKKYPPPEQKSTPPRPPRASRDLPGPPGTSPGLPGPLPGLPGPPRASRPPKRSQKRFLPSPYGVDACQKNGQNRCFFWLPNRRRKRKNGCFLAFFRIFPHMKADAIFG